MFSIIIPLYNKAPYVEKAIRSVLSQTYQDFELIVVDDGSTDNSLKIVKDFKISRFQDFKIIEQKNSGVSTARNNGVKMAKYDYIAFLDADDWWAPTFLEEMKGLVEKYPEAGLYASSYYKVKRNQLIPAQIGVPEGFSEGYFNYCKAYARSLWMPVTSITAVVRRAMFDELRGFKPSLKLGEDFDLWIRIALKYKTALLNKPLAYYNQNVELDGRAIGRLYDTENHMLWNLDFLVEEEIKNPDLKQLLDSLRTYGLFQYYLNKGTREKAKQELEKVDWSKQAISVKLRYKKPITQLKIELWVKSKLFKLKTKLIQ